MKKNIIFIAAAFIVTAYLISFMFNHPTYILDCIFSYLAIGAFFLLERKYPLKPWLIILGIIPFVLELTGLTFGFFAFSIFGFGFDKMLHLVNSFIITVLLYLWISTDYKKHKIIMILIVMLVVIGFGSLGEILEFLGQRYFHIYGPGMFSQGDLLPSTFQNDLKNYDTWWDMIINAVGALLAGIILFFKKK
ncbi:TPA: hypothetical protein HA235_07815 [Candidatus Woesearchaeota archaeon]|nr:hypothetical protein [Candidatus Woesearchaeota archaeon]HIH32585.1 hypothetical protein [Candidatus Woesearchaeota archaeon]HIH54748.1 hypothetical protein [Candidatus Woesearchaeota archaeon]HIJ02098.1 hypothetical protein [Candidatus Woesearchaeota archaeon]HIJ14703.1 hypothetical protein [Candidatus Woesearchaeota archaeon]